MTSEISFEVQTQTEIWRTKDLTFNVMYPTHGSAVVMAMRGKFTRKHYQGLNNILYELGISTLIFERDVDGELHTRKVSITAPLANVTATTFKRTK